MADDNISAILDVDDDAEFEDAVGRHKVDMGTIKRCLKQLQESCRATKGRFPTNVLEVFTLATWLLEKLIFNAPEKMEGSAANVGVTEVDALMRVLENVKNGEFILTMIAKAQKEMKDKNYKMGDSFQVECGDEIIAWKTAALDSQKTFARKRDEAVSMDTLAKAERDSVDSRYHEVLAALGRIVKVREDNNDISFDTLVKLRELYDQDRSGAVSTHLAELLRP